MRRSVFLLSGGMKEYHEWHLREPLLINYEGWRILDNPTMTRTECWVTDFGGYVRHLDPIIDDPRLTHKQRVCRLYKWALREMMSYITRSNAAKFNIGYKVIRGRFEKYRYVTDPAMCDLMIRETQKYLRDMCNNHYMKRNPTSPNMNCFHIHGMFHPDHSFCYDHWTQPEVHWYDDAKMHRYRAHHPMNGEQEFSNRFGDGYEVSPFFLFWMKLVYGAMLLWAYGHTFTLWHWYQGVDDPDYNRFQKQFDMNMRQVIEYEERCQRSRRSSSMIEYNWDQVIHSKVGHKYGYTARAGEFIERPQWVIEAQARAKAAVSDH